MAVYVTDVTGQAFKVVDGGIGYADNTRGFLKYLQHYPDRWLKVFGGGGYEYIHPRHIVRFVER